VLSKRCTRLIQIKVSVSVKKAIATNVRGVVGKTKLEKKATVYLPKNEKIELA
jgi:hypothetical protein